MKCIEFCIDLGVAWKDKTSFDMQTSWLAFACLCAVYWTVRMWVQLIPPSRWRWSDCADLMLSIKPSTAWSFIHLVLQVLMARGMTVLNAMFQLVHSSKITIQHCITDLSWAHSVRICTWHPETRWSPNALQMLSNVLPLPSRKLYLPFSYLFVGVIVCDFSRFSNRIPHLLRLL